MEKAVKRLADKVAIITGGAGSIGKTTAKLFLDNGAKVFLVDLDEDSLKKVADDLGSKNIKYAAADVTKSEDVKRYVAEAVNAFGTIDIFFNNAGIEGVVKPTIDYPEDIFDKVIAVNVKGVFLGNKYVLPKMNDGGSVILTASVAGIAGSPNVTAYIASKHAVVGMMRNLAIEVAPRKIRVNTINPSPVDNRMMRSLEAGYSPDDAAGMKKAFENSIPLGRYADPIEIAQLVQFLASDESKFITGTTQVIDGGMNA
ncbi:SDR family NAD(P)-dependent oxidoreductase [Psychroserpens mesophilus]|jgi:NAD(P)-dependent dehydrogenase (short-subunit alcohol dehydrogenase family)|uniref:SDR family NAD(P)-dependent oxidoreductase n=1 Tax=Psychroserpens mesophilus TaxID=325473 RepID=UPI003D65C954